MLQFDSCSAGELAVFSEIADGSYGASEKEAKSGKIDKAREQAKAEQSSKPPISRIRAFDAEVVGALLMSDDHKSTLVILELTTDYAEKRNRPVIEAIEA